MRKVKFGIIGCGRTSDATTSAYVPVAEAGFILQPQNFLDLAHGKILRRHLYLPDIWNDTD